MTWHCGCRRDFDGRGFGMHRTVCLFRGSAWPTVVEYPAEAARAD